MSQATKQRLDAMAVADSLRPTLLRLARQLRREKIAGVSAHQVGLLVAIKYVPGVNVGELAAEERVSTAAMSKRVSRLERNGLVARTKSEADRRRVGLTLTDEGRSVLRRVRSRRTAWLATRLGDLNSQGRPTIDASVGPLSSFLPGDGRSRACATATTGFSSRARSSRRPDRGFSASQ